MPRRARHYIAHQSYHLVQRGNNREACFIEPENYQFYLELWKELSQKFDVAVHAYCLMTNHIHFLVTPGSADAISIVTKRVGSRYAQYINKKYKRTATLWEGRHKASLVQTEKYLLTCYRYIELNAVRAGMVESPKNINDQAIVHAWNDKSWIVPHMEHLSLGNAVDVRGEAYRALFKGHFSKEELQNIRRATRCCQPLGDYRFAEFIKERYGAEWVLDLSVRDGQPIQCC